MGLRARLRGRGVVGHVEDCGAHGEKSGIRRGAERVHATRERVPRRVGRRGRCRGRRRECRKASDKAREKDQELAYVTGSQY